MERNNSVYLLSLLFFLIAIVFAAVRVQQLEVPFFPDRKVSSWRIDVRVSGQFQGGPAKLALKLPQGNLNYEIVDETFTSDGFPLATISSKRERRAIWISRDVSPKPVPFSYQITARPSEEVDGDTFQRVFKREQDADEEPVLSEERVLTARRLIAQQKKKYEGIKLAKKLASKLARVSGKKALAIMGNAQKASARSARIIATVLSEAGFEVQEVRGIPLSQPERSLRFQYWIFLRVEGEVLAYDLESSSWGKPEGFLVWSYNSEPLIEASGVTEPKLSLSVSPLEYKEQLSRVQRARRASGPVAFLTLDLLPVGTQATYRTLLLLPLAALIVALLRNVVGITPFGTFMPALIALSFRETKLFWGVVLLVGVVTLGLLCRAFFTRLRLLLVPRLTATLTLVVVLFLLVSLFSAQYGFDQGFAVSFFPMVIITMIIERMANILEERGLGTALTQAAYSLVAAVAAYFVIMIPEVGYWFYHFPEMLFAVLGAAVLLGRYNGYRLIELIRFREFVQDSKAS